MVMVCFGTEASATERRLALPTPPKRRGPPLHKGPHDEASVWQETEAGVRGKQGPEP